MDIRRYICQHCREKDIDENMVIVKQNGANKRYHKDSCYPAYLEEQKFKEQEKREFDELIEVIKEVHDIKKIPNQFYPFLQDIRNGNEMFGRIGDKKYKEGYRYSVIAETYKYCQDSIEWALKNRDFRGSLMNMLKYTRAIILDKIDAVNSQFKKKEEREKAREQTLDQAYDFSLDVTKNAKATREDELDISSFL